MGVTAFVADGTASIYLIAADQVLLKGREADDQSKRPLETSDLGVSTIIHVQSFSLVLTSPPSFQNIAISKVITLYTTLSKDSMSKLVCAQFLSLVWPLWVAGSEMR